MNIKVYILNEKRDTSCILLKFIYFFKDIINVHENKYSHKTCFIQ